MSDIEKKPMVRYNRELLDLSLKRDNATIQTSYTGLTRESIISFTCNCGSEKSKSLLLVYKFGAYCDKCRKVKTSEKTKSTNIVKFGVDNPSKNTEIKKKMEETNIKKYGVKNFKEICVNNNILVLHPNIAKEWHPSKNNNNLPINFTGKSNKKVWWLCPKKCPMGCVHEWQAIINSRTRVGGCGCPYCSNRKVCVHTSIVTTHPDIAKEWHPTKNGGLKASDVCFGSGKKMWWLCPKKCPEGCVHEWETNLEHRTKHGCGCPYCCVPQKKICEHSSIEYTHPNIAKEWHPTKNENLLASHVSYNSDRKVWWLCEKNHEFESTVGNRYYGTGCSLCKNKTEAKILKYIIKHYSSIKSQFKEIENCKNVFSLPFDFCIPELKVIIEIDGAQHFKQVSNWTSPEKTMERDIFKMRKAIEAGYKVIRIFQEDVWNNDENWLGENLLPHIQSAERDSVFISSKDDMYDEHINLLNSDVEIHSDDLEDEVKNEIIYAL